MVVEMVGLWGRSGESYENSGEIGGILYSGVAQQRPNPARLSPRHVQPSTTHRRAPRYLGWGGTDTASCKPEG
ncbi:MAG: hypothetical protein ACI87O_001960 [Planctomycetota bacterium]|jgi:hypothetical protein